MNNKIFILLCVIPLFYVAYAEQITHAIGIGYLIILSVYAYAIYRTHKLTLGDFSNVSKPSKRKSC